MDGNDCLLLECVLLFARAEGLSPQTVEQVGRPPPMAIRERGGAARGLPAQHRGAAATQGSASGPLTAGPVLLALLTVSPSQASEARASLRGRP